MWNGGLTVTKWCVESKNTFDLLSTAQEQQQQPARAMHAAVQLALSELRIGEVEDVIDVD